jgi:predicted house-cleaning NTP pyrophosphatase (Maf/HAM1 superfamily)
MPSVKLLSKGSITALALEQLLDCSALTETSKFDIYLEVLSETTLLLFSEWREVLESNGQYSILGEGYF